MTTQMATALDVHVQTILTTVQAALQPLLPAAKVLFRILIVLLPHADGISQSRLAHTNIQTWARGFFQVITPPPSPFLNFSLHVRFYFGH